MNAGLLKRGDKVLSIVKNCSVPSAPIDRSCLDIRGVESVSPKGWKSFLLKGLGGF